MSVVSGVVLVCNDVLDGDGYAEPLGAVNAWLDAHYGSPGRLADVTDHCGGNKHPQCFVLAAGLNYLDEEAFAHHVLSLPWSDPETVVLVIRPEEGPTRVWKAPW